MCVCGVTNVAADPEAAVRVLLEMVGEDPDRDGLLDTPARVVKAWKEMTTGYADDPAAILATTFDEPFDEMVVMKDYPFVSLCEHHVLPFAGVVKVGYIPVDRVVGLSKLGRLVDCFARRLQIQERLTNDIGVALDGHLDPEGVAVVVEATHECMAHRGVNKPAVMVTSYLSGEFRENLAARSEFLAL
jgi:GTP cyclohydrolase I